MQGRGCLYILWTSQVGQTLIEKSTLICWCSLLLLPESHSVATLPSFDPEMDQEGHKLESRRKLCVFKCSNYLIFDFCWLSAQMSLRMSCSPLRSSRNWLSHYFIICIIGSGGFMTWWGLFWAMQFIFCMENVRWLAAGAQDLKGSDTVLATLRKPEVLNMAVQG